MFQVESIGNRIEITMSGALNAESMKDALDQIQEKCSKIENGTMLYDVVDFHLPTLEAIMIEFSRLPSMIGLLGKFKRAAVLTDLHWLGGISIFEGLLIPGLSIKAFRRDQKAEAIEWLEAES
ncbi:MAG: STAS/SEC14 domain-containing protein [Leptospiraceae bacterium]|nr:STAS/SEC14 domain-containing protein [Leptospiraceae bacterium]